MRRWTALPYGACLRAAFATVGRVSRLSSSPLALARVGTRRWAQRVFLHVDLTTGPAVDVYSDYLFVQKGRAVVGFNFAFVGSKPPAFLERRVLRRVASRM